MRRRLVGVALAVSTMIVLAFLVPLTALVGELARSRAISGAERDAQLIGRLVTVFGAGASGTDALAALGIGSEVNGRPVSLILPDGTVAGAAVPPDEDLSAARAGGAGNRPVPGGAAVYVPVVGADGTMVVRVFVPRSELTRNVVRSWILLAGLGVALILIGVAAADRLGRSLVKPVEELSDGAERLGGGDLTTRVRPSGPPELVAVGHRFNELADRVATLLQEERELAADLSHRLRTPLTVIRLDAESLAPGSERDRLLSDLGELERTIDHIIREARRAGRQGEATLTDLAATVSDRATFWEALAAEQGRASRLTTVDGPLFVRMPDADLRAALDAVLGNVFAHTPDETGYEVTVETDGQVARVVVADEGPGLDGESAVERGESSAGSTGLGLDIARRTAEVAGGRLIAASDAAGGGARIVIEVPIAPESRG